jgi:hypothetical protein
MTQNLAARFKAIEKFGVRAASCLAGPVTGQATVLHLP